MRTSLLTENELTTSLYSDWVTAHYNRNLDDDRLVLSYREEVSVKAVVLYRMVLKLVNDSCVGLAVVKFDVDDE